MLRQPLPCEKRRHLAGPVADRRGGVEVVERGGSLGVGGHAIEARGGEQPAEVGVALLRLGQERQVLRGCIGCAQRGVRRQRHLRPEDGVQAGAAGGAPEAHDPRERIVVGERQCVKSQHLGARHKRLGERGAVKQ